MSKVLCESQDLTNIADAIREKTNTTDTMAVSSMAYNINSISNNGISDEYIAQIEQNTSNINQLSQDKVDKTGVTLGIASDGLIYLFVDGNPVGTGIPQGQSGDVFGYIDENNTIVLKGNLVDETYTVKYEKENGDVVNIGDLVLETIVEIINQIPISTDTDGTIYNGIGYKTNTRIKSGGVAETYSGVSATGFIPAKVGDTVYIKGFVISIDGLSKIHLYKEDKSSIGLVTTSSFTDCGNGVYSYIIPAVVGTGNNDATDTAYIRAASNHIMDGSEILTINQPIE